MHLCPIACMAEESKSIPDLLSSRSGNPLRGFESLLATALTVKDRAALAGPVHGGGGTRTPDTRIMIPLL